MAFLQTRYCSRRLLRNGRYYGYRFVSDTTVTRVTWHHINTGVSSESIQITSRFWRTDSRILKKLNKLDFAACTAVRKMIILTIVTKCCDTVAKHASRPIKSDKTRLRGVISTGGNATPFSRMGLS